MDEFITNHLKFSHPISAVLSRVPPYDKQNSGNQKHADPFSGNCPQLNPDDKHGTCDLSPGLIDNQPIMSSHHFQVAQQLMLRAIVKQIYGIFVMQIDILLSLVKMKSYDRFASFRK